MSRVRFSVMLPAALVLSAAAVTSGSSATPPVFSKPKPVTTAPNVAPLPPADFDNTLDVSGDNVKARNEDTRLSVDVAVNGRGPYRFIVDSGADTSVVSQGVARDLELPLGKPLILDGMTARNIVDSVKVAQLTVGLSTVDNLELPALKETDLGGDGMLGIDALAHQRLMMDFENKLISVEDARTPVKHYPGEIVITGRRQHGQLILAHVTAAGLPLDAVIDTGSEVTIGNLALRDKLIRTNPDKFATVQAIGVTGEVVNLQVARIGELRLGSVILRDVPIAFADVTPFKVFGLDNGPALLLGTDVLGTFRRVSLAFRARKVRFQLRHCDSLVSISTIAGMETTHLFSPTGIGVCES